MRLLVVDDDPDILDLLIFKLKRAGFDVTSASDGDTAITASRAERPDLVVLDWAMPGADGLEVCAELRRNPDTADVPVILLTAKAQEADLQRGMARIPGQNTSSGHGETPIPTVHSAG